MSDITWTTHPRLPITEGITVEGRSYTASELEIIAVQLNAGVTYQDEMASRCRDAWMALHPSTDLCITRDDGKEDDEGERLHADLRDITSWTAAAACASNRLLAAAT